MNVGIIGLGYVGLPLAVEFSKKITKNDLSKKSFIEGLFSSLKSKMYGKK